MQVRDPKPPGTVKLYIWYRVIRRVIYPHNHRWPGGEAIPRGTWTELHRGIICIILSDATIIELGTAYGGQYGVSWLVGLRWLSVVYQEYEAN